ncbi:MAG: hypothetical protein IKN49_06735 [Elusimicrobiaceae bacterium]|nr:hypothetical protein [Elusimicrobiaceae bacterium]
MEYTYTLKYDGSGGYIGKTPIYSQAINAAKGYAKTYGLSVLVSHTWKNKTREIVIHPDETITHLWNGER